MPKCLLKAGHLIAGVFSVGYNNLLTGLSDHNMILTVRKLTKKQLEYFSTNNPGHVKTFIPKSEIVKFEQEFANCNWDHLRYR